MSPQHEFSALRIFPRPVLVVFLGAAVIGIGVAGCSRNPKSGKPATAPAGEQQMEKPAEQTQAMPGTGAPEKAASQPATSQAAPPVLKSEFDRNPPYTVKLYVHDPEEKQPGWLKIEEMNDKHRLATSVGTFPEHNRIYVDTDNVRRIRIHLGLLPLTPDKRTVLSIDNQPMELVRKGRKYVYLELQSNGAWHTVAPEKEEK